MGSHGQGVPGTCKGVQGSGAVLGSRGSGVRGSEVVGVLESEAIPGSGGLGSGGFHVHDFIMPTDFVALDLKMAKDDIKKDKTDSPKEVFRPGLRLLCRPIRIDISPGVIEFSSRFRSCPRKKSLLFPPNSFLPSIFNIATINLIESCQRNEEPKPLSKKEFLLLKLVETKNSISLWNSVHQNCKPF